MYLALLNIIIPILHLVLDLFSLPEGLHCLFKLGLKEHHIDGREVKSTVVDF